MFHTFPLFFTYFLRIFSRGFNAGIMHRQPDSKGLGYECVVAVHSLESNKEIDKHSHRITIRLVKEYEMH